MHNWYRYAKQIVDRKWARDTIASKPHIENSIMVMKVKPIFYSNSMFTVCCSRFQFNSLWILLFLSSPSFLLLFLFVWMSLSIRHHGKANQSNFEHSNHRQTKTKSKRVKKIFEFSSSQKPILKEKHSRPTSLYIFIEKMSIFMLKYEPKNRMKSTWSK